MLSFTAAVVAEVLITNWPGQTNVTIDLLVKLVLLATTYPSLATIKKVTTNLTLLTNSVLTLNLTTSLCLY